MATTIAEKTSVPMFDIKSPLDITKFNPVAAEYPNVNKAQNDILNANDVLIKSLEARYADPNWFNVAAGFFKPQLGGFAASLGSAAQALGENVESQRAIAPTVARMRAETAQGRLGMETNKSQYQALQDYNKAGVNDTKGLQRILAMNPDSDIGKAVIKKMELDQSNRANVNFELEVQEKLLNNPSLALNNLKNPSLEFGRTLDQAAVNLRAMNAAVPPGYERSAWENLGYGDKANALAAAQSKRAGMVMEEGQKSSQKADDAHGFLDLAAPTRALAVDPNLAPLFSLGKNGDLFSQARAFLNAKGGDTNAAVEGLYAAAMDKLKNASPETRQKADKLIKNIFSMEVQMRGGVHNPTDVATFLNAQRSPNLENSQAGFVGILDQLGLNAYRDIEEHGLRKQLKIPNSELVDTATLRKFRNETRRLASDMAGKSALDSTPSFYYSTEPSAQTPPPPTAAAATTPAPTAAAATTPTQRSAVRGTPLPPLLSPAAEAAAAAAAAAAAVPAAAAPAVVSPAPAAPAVVSPAPRPLPTVRSAAAPRTTLADIQAEIARRAAAAAAKGKP